MRRATLLLLGFLLCAAALRAAEQAPTSKYPPWDNQESVEAYAQRAGLPPAMTLVLGDGVKLELALIPAGTFIMGTPEPTPPEAPLLGGLVIVGLAAVIALVILARPLRRIIQKRQRPQISLGRFMLFCLALALAVFGLVRNHMEAEALYRYELAKVRAQAAEPAEQPAQATVLAQPFYIGKYEVTQAQYEAIMGANPSRFRGQDLPVDTVSWADAKSFADALAQKSGRKVRLPAESEWEYACRAGTSTNYGSGDSLKELDRAGWYKGNSGGRTHPVGQKEPNAWGLYDMHGNVLEWCEDSYTPAYGKRESWPLAPLWLSEYRMLRGGSWYMGEKEARSANRAAASPDQRLEYFGLRVVVEVE